MDKPRHQQPGYETVPQPFMSDQASARFLPHNPNASDAKHVHNYSIQTGEEFSLEFMRDRAIPPQRSSNHPNGSAPDMNPNHTGYMELRSLLGISHAGSDCAENGLRDYDRANPSLGHVQSAPPQALISKDRSLGNLGSSLASGSVTAKVKILCSFGGKILPRPGDSKLRYVGGETHIISVRKDISWLALKQKILKIYYQTHVVKYQLPGEDLDALVSVSCEEDLQNMFEEYYEMENRGGSQKLRMFLFSINDLDDDALLGVNRNDGDSEFQYVVAVNGMDIGPGRNSIPHGRDSSSANNLAELGVRNNEGISNIAGDVVGVSAPQLMANGVQQSSGQQSESIPPSSSLYYSQSIPPSAAYQLQQPVPPSSALHYSQSIPQSSSIQYPQSVTPDSSIQYPQSITPDSSLQYPQSITPGSASSYGMFPPYYGHVVQHGEQERFPLYNSNYSGMAETTGSIPFQGHVNQQGGWAEGYLYPGTTPQSTQAIVEEQKVSPDTKVHEHAETENCKTLAKDHQSPPQLDDVEVRNQNQPGGTFTSPRGDTRQNTPAKPATYRDAVIAGQVPLSGNEDQLATSSGTNGPIHNDSESNLIDLNYPEPVQSPPRVYRSENTSILCCCKDGPGGTLATVTEYMVDGSLRHVLVRRDRHLDRRKRLIIAMDAAFGMEYLHSKNIVHFDLKCDNLLVNLKDPSRPICKVGDFGLSKIKRNTLVSGGVRGTLPWMAPELLNGSSSKVSEKVDVFSFGIVLWEILTGEEPYANMHYGAIIGGIVNNTLRPTIPAFCDDEWRTLMEECWAPNPTARPSFTEIAGRLRVMSSAATSTQSKPPTHRASR
ncbi:hypothetical protein Bca52824_007226 [Brassica carinata]|uniref:Protein kinase domain-containing protein n=1 Tax=Brassica carinata TaxID=52824 RepID=A0A8X7W5W5_BRACI|nr:hypothetical protein Bca52824_007226 [Brassica carinata]